MKNSLRKIGKVIFFVYLAFLHLVLLNYLYEKFVSKYYGNLEINSEAVSDPLDEQAKTTPIPLPTFSEEIPETANTNESSANTNLSNETINPSEVNSNNLMIPVAGVKPEQLRDTFSDARSEGRVHNALDIMAPLGTPVVAAADGEIAKFFDSKLGGITIYQYSADKKMVYYYAHLSKRAENISEKEFVKQGTIIGYVGDTGNAGAGNYHLHFSVYRIENPTRYWEGENLNPYDLLKTGIEASP